jgi:amidase
MKATHGLVPSYGMSYVDHTIDHIGPMTKTVEENAAVLEVIAGPDWRDPQWVRHPPEAGEYVAAKNEGVQGLRIGVVRESLEPAGTIHEVLVAFTSAVTKLEKLGAEIVYVDMPMWPFAMTVLMGCIIPSHYGMWITYGQGFGHLGRVDPNTVAVNAAHQRLCADDLPPMLKSNLLAAEHLRSAYLGVPYAKAQNLRIELRRQISESFKELDLLITPTTPDVAFELLNRKGSIDDRLAANGISAVRNTSPLNLSGHPALTIPAGFGPNSLPVGLQIIGPHFAEALVYRAGFALEGA